MCIRKKEQVIPPKENIQTRNYEDKMNRNQTLELIEKTKQKSVSTTTNSVDMTKSKSISMQHVVEKPKSNSEINVELPGKKVEGNVVETPKIMHQIPPSGAPEPRSPIKPMNNVVKTAEENVEIPIPKIYEYHRSKTDENDDGNQLLKLLQHPANYWKYMDMVSIENCDKISGNYCFQNRHTPNENEWNLFAGHSDNGAVIVEKLIESADIFLNDRGMVSGNNKVPESLYPIIRHTNIESYIWARCFAREFSSLLDANDDNVLILTMTLFADGYDLKSRGKLIRKIKDKTASYIADYGLQVDRLSYYPLPLLFKIHITYNHDYEIFPTEKPNMEILSCPKIIIKPSEMDRNGHRLWYNLIDNRLTIHDDESERIYHQEIIKFRKDKEKGPRTKPKRRTKISKNSMNSNSNSISNTSSKSTSTKDDEKKKKKKRKLLVEYQPNYGTRTEDTQGTEEPQNSVKNGKNNNEKISGIEVKAGSSSEKTGRNENVDKSAEKCGPKEGKSMLKTDSGEIADPKISSDDENDGKKLEKSNTNDDLKDINL